MSSAIIIPRNEYKDFLASHYNLMVTFDADSYNPTLIYETLPIASFLADVERMQRHSTELARLDRQELLIIKLLVYFKEEFFKWIDTLCCERCDGKQCTSAGTDTARTYDERRYFASRVELYRCVTCGMMYRFPRYNDPRKLLETRSGRCGEWANCFAYILRCLDITVRLVYSTKDHVWIEYYNQTDGRWLHVDPCESELDNPYLYEIGWGKELDLIVARGEHELRDVTWRYVTKWKVTAKKRAEKFDETTLRYALTHYNDLLQRNLPQHKRDEIEERWIRELVEFIRLPGQEVINVDDRAKEGRKSGALAWRLARTEMGGNSGAIGSGNQPPPPPTAESSDSDDPQRIIIKFHHNNSYDLHKDGDARQLKWITFAYNCNNNVYRLWETVAIREDSEHVRLVEIEELYHGWKQCASYWHNVARNEEHDWQMCYLARMKNCNANEQGKIVWRFQLPTPLPQSQTEESLSSPNKPDWQKMMIRMKGDTFGSAEHPGQLRATIRLYAVTIITINSDDDEDDDDEKKKKKNKTKTTTSTLKIMKKKRKELIEFQLPLSQWFYLERSKLKLLEDDKLKKEEEEESKKKKKKEEEEEQSSSSKPAPLPPPESTESTDRKTTTAATINKINECLDNLTVDHKMPKCQSSSSSTVPSKSSTSTSTSTSPIITKEHEMEIEVQFDGGDGGCAWQHAQLFRQPLKKFNRARFQSEFSKEMKIKDDHTNREEDYVYYDDEFDNEADYAMFVVKLVFPTKK